MSVTKLPNKKKDTATEILKRAMEEDYDEVIIAGFKDGRFYMLHSELSDGAKVIGALTMMQYEILKYGD
jgi:hypothetical protein